MIAYFMVYTSLSGVKNLCQDLCNRGFDAVCSRNQEIAGRDGRGNAEKLVVYDPEIVDGESPATMPIEHLAAEECELSTNAETAALLGIDLSGLK